LAQATILTLVAIAIPCRKFLRNTATTSATSSTWSALLFFVARSPTEHIISLLQLEEIFGYNGPSTVPSFDSFVVCALFLPFFCIRSLFADTAPLVG
jgi:hypothetical protein